MKDVANSDDRSPDLAVKVSHAIRSMTDSMTAVGVPKNVAHYSGCQFTRKDHVIILKTLGIIYVSDVPTAIFAGGSPH
jgi:hypothetical protein